ncbi:MAG: DUF3343 domain-containing protein [Coriobacteriales bacterium]|jgi:hypothetical protein|nr:DUF3343 domain-containing protein [Coriobacteriales bacterium]
MRRRQLKAVVVFASTSDAIAMESGCHAAGVAGRLIPVPTEIAADCGLAWCSPEAELPNIERVLADNGLGFTGVHLVALY